MAATTPRSLSQSRLTGRRIRRLRRAALLLSLPGIAALAAPAQPSALAAAGECRPTARSADCVVLAADSRALSAVHTTAARAHRAATRQERRALSAKGARKRSAWAAAIVARRDARRIAAGAVRATGTLRRGGANAIGDPGLRRLRQVAMRRTETEISMLGALSGRRLALLVRRRGRSVTLPSPNGRLRASGRAGRVARARLGTLAARARLAESPPLSSEAVWSPFNRRMAALASQARSLLRAAPRSVPPSQRVERAASLRSLARAQRGLVRDIRRDTVHDHGCAAEVRSHLTGELVQARQWVRFAAALGSGRVERQRKVLVSTRVWSGRVARRARAVRACFEAVSPQAAPQAPPGSDITPPRIPAVLPGGLPPAQLPPPVEDAFDAALRHAQERIADRLARTAAETPVDRFPFYTDSGAWTTAGGAAWISGFFPGSLWLEYQRSGDAEALAQATSRQSEIRNAIDAQLAADPDWSNHDLGFMLLSSFGNGHRLSGEDDHRQRVLERAGIVADRYVPAAKVIRAFSGGLADPEVVAITDTLMNAELLMWAARNGGEPDWRSRAVDHALTTRAEHIRGDGSVYHVVVFDAATGDVLRRSSRGQGHSTESVWARGQAWAMHGFAMMFRETGDPRFLDAARRVSDWYLDHLPPDAVPYWDFLDPGIPDAPRDSSAAAIAAAALVDLGRMETDAARADRYLDEAGRILAALAAPPYLSEGDSDPAALLHATYNFHAGRGIDESVSWGDMYFLQAMLRRRLAPADLPSLPAKAFASRSDEGAVGNVQDGDLGTRWAASGDGQWLRLDLGAERIVSKIAVAFHRGDRRVARIEIATSSDGLTWTTGSTPVSSGTSLGLETFDVPDVRARHVRILGRGNTEDEGIAITEVRVH